MTIEARPFGRNSYGEAVTAYTLIGEGGAASEILDYGATVRSLLVPDGAGGMVDVVLGYDSIGEYESNGGFLGASIGRVCNRIGGARFYIGGREYVRSMPTTAANHAPRRGAARSFDKYVWERRGPRAASSRTPACSPGRRGGLSRATLDVTVSLRAHGQDNCALPSPTTRTRTPLTPVSLNEPQLLQLKRRRATCSTHRAAPPRRPLLRECAPDCLPHGPAARRRPARPFDFRSERVLGEALAEECEQTALFGGFDHNYVLSGSRGRESVRARERYRHGRVHYAAGHAALHRQFPLPPHRQARLRHAAPLRSLPGDPALSRTA